MATLGDLVVNLLGNAQPLQQTFAKGTGMVKDFVAKTQSMVSSVAGSLGSALSFDGALKAAGDDIAAGKKLDAVLAATGNTTGFTSEALKQLGTDLQNTTNFADELTVSAIGVLATFKNISGTNFKSAVGLAQDLSALKDQDLQSSILQIGKALDNPIEGMAALEKATGKLSASQREQIETLARSGQIAEAQGVVLGILKDKFGGVAQAMANPVSQLKNQIGELAEQVGFAFMPFLQAIVPKVIQFFQEWGPQIGKAVAALFSLQAGMRALAAAQAVVAALSGPAGWASLAVAATVAGGAYVALSGSINTATDAARNFAMTTQERMEKAAQMRGGLTGDLTQTDDAETLVAQLRNFRKFAAASPAEAKDAFLEAMDGPALFLEKLTGVNQQMKNLGETRRLFGQIGDMLGLDPAKGQEALGKSIDKIIGLEDAIRGAREEGEKLHGNFDAIGAALAKFKDGTAGGLAQLKDQLKENERLQSMKPFQDSTADLLGKISDLKTGLGELGPQVRAFEKAGIKAPDIDKWKALNQELKDLQAADALKKAVATPLDTLREKLLEIHTLLAKGLITDEVAHEAIEKAQEAFLSAEGGHGTGGRFAAGVEKDTSAAYSAILASLPQTSSANADAKQTAKNALAEAKKQTALLQKIGQLPKAPPVNLIAGGPI